MTTFVALLCVVPFAVSFIALLVTIVNAKDGWEDEQGFHKGKKP